MLSEYKMALPLRTVENAEPEARELLESTQKKLGFIPNMYFAMANSPGLLGTYINGYSDFREQSGFDNAEQEVIFLTISQSNGCEYCVAAHSFLADTVSGTPADVIQAIREGQSISDIKLNALSHFTRIMIMKHGLPDRNDVDAFLSAGYSENQILEIILAIAVKTISNYTNHIFHTDVDNIFAQHKWADKP